MTSKRQREKGWLLPEELTGYPLVCVQFQIPDTREYRAATRGAIYELTRRWNWQWEGKGDYKPRDVAQIFRELIDDTLAFNEECSGAAEKSGCIDIPLDSPILEWNPNDPFRTPELVPAGYAYPPWYKANSLTNVTLGTSLGDVLTDIFRTTSIPVIPPASGYPRVRIHLKGSGTVELHFVKLNAGGYVQITTDDDVFSAEFCSLDKDIIAIPPETTDDIIIERVVQGDGDHHIDLLFVPKVNDELLPPVKQGGAIRKIVLCGFDEMPDYQDCPDCEDCPEDDCGGDCEDLFDRFDVADCEELEELMDCAMPFLGQVVAGIVPPTGGGWLKCDGTGVSKAVYPELYAILAGMVDEDAENFNLPDFRDRIPMGAGSIVNVLAAAGESAHTLTVAEMPEHAHDSAAHSHTTEEHYHTTPNHTHSIEAHTHSIPSHTHNVTIPGHSHTIPGRNNSALGASGRFPVTNGTGTVNDTISTGSDGGGTFATTSGGSGTTGANSAGGNTNSGGAGNTSAETVTVNAGGGGATSTQGQGEAFPIIPPVLGVHWFIFAGCKEGC